MSFLQKMPSLKTVATIAVATVALYSGLAFAQSEPSQTPLLNRDGGGVPPNIMLTMDDSGSMTWSHMPEETVYIGSYSIANPVGSNGARMDPGEPSSDYVAFIGTIAAVPGNTNYRQRLMRSPDTNTVYYNPETRYYPWATAAGGRMTAYPASAAPIDPMSPATTVNLTNIRNVNISWCYGTSTATGCSSADRSYDPGLYYRLNKVAGVFQNPNTGTNYTEYSINSGSTFTKFTARTDCTGSSCTQAEERQNFANWFTYYRTRNLLARGAMMEAFFDANNTFRLGWGRINQGNSRSIDGVNTQVIEAGVRAFDATTKASLFTWLGALPASGSTPLPRAMRAVGEYYKRSDNKGPWSDNPGQVNTTADKSCRRSYQIMVTDGYWNQTTTSVGNSDNTNGAVITGPGRTYQYTPVDPYRDGYSDRLADYAMQYWKTDLRTDLTNNVISSAENPAFWQHMVNFMVGLGVRGTLNPETDLPALTNRTKVWGSDEIDDLWHSALNSRGAFFNAKDPKSLASAVQLAIGQALTRELREAGVATAASTLQDGNRKYIPFYRTAEWSGDVQAYVLDALGQTGALAWSALAKVPTWASRNIYTLRSDSGTPVAVPFTWTDMGALNRAALGTVGTTYGTEFVNFLRGDRSKEGDGQPFRKRAGILGDFINSNPVLVKAGQYPNPQYEALPALQGGGGAYTTYRTQMASRTPVLFVGGNAGMLHAFKDTLGAVPADDGKEVFAYVPQSVYPNLSKLSDKLYGTTSLPHQYFVDGPLADKDVFVRAPAASAPSWRNYLLGALGSGGRAVFALDVTDTASLTGSAIRWELSNATQPDLGYVYAPIQTGVLPNGEWVAIFGNGRYSDNGRAALFVVNLETGAAQTLVVDSTGSNGLSGVGIVRNSSGQITSLYAGDLKGHLWKFEYNATAASRFQVAGAGPLFNATGPTGLTQPITQAPRAYYTAMGGVLVMFGTGTLTTEAEANSADVQSTYVVWDNPADPASVNMNRTMLSQKTMATVVDNSDTFYTVSGPAINWSAQHGWFFDMNVHAGLRLVYPIQAIPGFDNYASLKAIAPARNVQVCESASGIGVNLFLRVDGTSQTYPMFDTNGDGVINSSDLVVSAYQGAADGQNAILIGSRVCDASGVCSQNLSNQDSSGGKNMVLREESPPPSGARTIRDRVWRRIINPPIR